MARDPLPLTDDEFIERLCAAGPATADDVSITRNGRRLDSRMRYSPGSPGWRRIAPPVATSSSMTTEPPALDIDRILDVLKRHEVEFLLVGGVAAIASGARRPTSDLDCVTPQTEGS